MAKAKTYLFWYDLLNSGKISTDSEGLSLLKKS